MVLDQKGIVRIHFASECEPFLSDIGEKLMVQQIVGTDDEEYTVSAFF